MLDLKELLKRAFVWFRLSPVCHTQSYGTRKRCTTKKFA